MVRAAAARAVRAAAVAVAALLALVWVCSATGCLYLAPLEEEEPKPDEPPWFDALEATVPEVGEVNIDLSTGPFVTFAVYDVQDINTQQTLYWRWVVNYSMQAVASVPETMLPEMRDLLQFRYQPCGFFHRQSAEDPVDTSHTLVLAVSDAPFERQSQQLFQDPSADVRVEKALATNPPGRATLVQWWLVMSNSCP